MQPNTPARPDAARQPLVEFVRTKRGPAGLILLAVAAALLGLAGWLGYKAFGKSEGAAEASEGPSIVSSANKPEYLVGFVLALAAAMPVLIAGARQLIVPPVPNEAEDRTRTRIAILAAGGLLGLVVMIAGLVYFYLWNIRSEPLTTPSIISWLERGDMKQARWVLLPVLAVLVGGALAFASTIPARVEERNNPQLRRLVYGSNFLLGAFLLFGVLIIANVVLSMKLPNRLDTTESGFYSLSPPTEEFLGKLDQPVTAYLILPPGEDRVIKDARRMLLRCQEASHGLFTVKAVNATDRDELIRLREAHPKVELNREGILLTVGPDEKRSSFITVSELVVDEPVGHESKQVFNGEPRLMLELAFLAENQDKPVIYFTQSNGELAIGDPPAQGGRSDPQRSARKLKAYLEKNYVTVKPLTFELQGAKVPDDAAIVVVAEPRTPLSDDAAKAIRQYLLTPKPNGKKGRLIVAAGTIPGVGDRVVKTGLEPLLEEFNIRLGDEFLYAVPVAEMPDPRVMLAMVDDQALVEGNLVARAFERAMIPLRNAREIRPLEKNPTYRILPLLTTVPGRPTWLEETPPPNLSDALQGILRNAEVAKSKKVQTEKDRDLAVFSTEGSTGRVAVFGAADFITDAATQGNATPKTFELFGGTVDWLRERPAIAPGTVGKAYTVYTLPSGTDDTRLLVLPLALTLFTIIGIGAGVWVIRRQ